MREIKFRGKHIDGTRWVDGDLLRRFGITLIYQPGGTIPVLPETVGQFTGLTDRNGVEIFEGDVIKYYTLGRYSQQSHGDIPPEINESVIQKNTRVVRFSNGTFVVDEKYPLIFLFDELSVEEYKDIIFGYDRKKYYSEEEMMFDCNGHPIDESIIGVEVIGNIHDNPELL